MKAVNLVALAFLFASYLHAKEPGCSGSERWPASMAFVHLKNAGITDNQKIDFTKTVVKKLTSQKIKNDLYKQVHLIEFHEKSGKSIQVITVNDATSDECSGSDVDVYVVSKHLGGK